MSFQTLVVSGTNLIIPAINSPGFVTGVSGWSINQDGSAEFQNVTIRGTITGATIVGSEFKSADYVAATSGFDLSGPPGGPDFVEFNTNVSVRGAGSITVGDPGFSGRITISPNGLIDFLNTNAGATDSLIFGSDTLSFQSGSNTTPLKPQVAQLSLSPGAAQGTVLIPNSSGLSAPSMRHATTASGGAAGQNITSTSYAALPGGQATSVVVTCPPSGMITIAFTYQFGINGGALSTDFIAMSVNVANTTQSTNPFTSSDNRSAAFDGNVTGGFTLSRTLTASSLGNAGDSLTVSMQARTSTSGAYFVERTDLTVIPSP